MRAAEEGLTYHYFLKEKLSTNIEWKGKFGFNKNVEVTREQKLKIIGYST